MRILVDIWANENDDIEREIYKSLLQNRDMNAILLEDDIYCAGFLTFLGSKNSRNRNQMTLKSISTFLL